MSGEQPDRPMTFQWLIERGQPEGETRAVWLENSGEHPARDLCWTTDAWRAAMFPTRESAEDYIRSQQPLGMEARAVEHGFASREPDSRSALTAEAPLERPSDEDARKALSWLMDDLANGGATGSPLVKRYAATNIAMLGWFEQEVARLAAALESAEERERELDGDLRHAVEVSIGLIKKGEELGLRAERAEKALAAAEQALRAVNDNALAWHAGEEGKARALNVIAVWTSEALAGRIHPSVAKIEAARAALVDTAAEGEA